MANDNKTVNTANLFNFSNGKLTALPTASSNVAVNTLIASTTPPRGPRVETVSLLDDALGAAGAGTEKGTAGSSNPATDALSKTLGVLGKINDVFSVGQHAVQGNGAEAVSEVAGVLGGTGGAAVGFQLGMATAPITGPLALPIAGIFAAGGAYVGADNAKKAGEFLTGGDTPDKLWPPTTLPNNTPLQPTAVDSSGNAYALVNVDGKFTWFAMLNNNSLPNQFVEVVSGSKVAELTNGYLKEAGFTELHDLKTQIDIAHQNGALDSSIWSALSAPDTNIAPNGQPWGKTVQTAPNASETSNPGAGEGFYTKTLDIQSAGTTQRIVQTIDKNTGQITQEFSYERSANSTAEDFKLTGERNFQRGAKIDFSDFNIRAAKVIRGLGQALGCTMDVAEAVGNASQGRCA